jgi:hypothetical protein
MKRSAEKDMELCRMATEGPWKNGSVRPTVTFSKGTYYSGVMNGNEDLGIALAGDESDGQSVIDSMFIAESREALPYWIQRATEAEELLKEALEFIDDCYIDEIEFRAKVKEFLGGGEG